MLDMPYSCMSSMGEATLLLQRLNGGDRTAEEDLFELVYGELRQVAAGLMRGERREHTLQPTALVHEAWLRLLAPGDGAEPVWRGQAHFICTAARAMRRLLVDHARARGSKKRGGELERVGLDEVVESYEEGGIDLVALDDALSALHELEHSLAQLVELHFFAGLSLREVAEVLGTTRKVVTHRWMTARAFLRRHIEHGIT